MKGKLTKSNVKKAYQKLKENEKELYIQLGNLWGVAIEVNPRLQGADYYLTVSPEVYEMIKSYRKLENIKKAIANLSPWISKKIIF